MAHNARFELRHAGGEAGAANDCPASGKRRVLPAGIEAGRARTLTISGCSTSSKAALDGSEANLICGRFGEAPRGRVGLAAACVGWRRFVALVDVLRARGGGAPACATPSWKRDTTFGRRRGPAALHTMHANSRPPPYTHIYAQCGHRAACSAAKRPVPPPTCASRAYCAYASPAAASFSACSTLTRAAAACAWGGFCGSIGLALLRLHCRRLGVRGVVQGKRGRARHPAAARQQRARREARQRPSAQNNNGGQGAPWRRPRGRRGAPWGRAPRGRRRRKGPGGFGGFGAWHC